MPPGPSPNPRNDFCEMFAPPTVGGPPTLHYWSNVPDGQRQHQSFWTLPWYRPHLLRVRLGSRPRIPAIFAYCGVFCRAIGEPGVKGGRSICLTQLTLVMPRPRSGPTRTHKSLEVRRRWSHSVPGRGTLQESSFVSPLLVTYTCYLLAYSTFL